jgi:Leucine-rich repeat (LRR) protein
MTSPISRIPSQLYIRNDDDEKENEDKAPVRLSENSGRRTIPSLSCLCLKKIDNLDLMMRTSIAQSTTSDLTILVDDVLTKLWSKMILNNPILGSDNNGYIIQSTAFAALPHYQKFIFLYQSLSRRILRVGLDNPFPLRSDTEISLDMDKYVSMAQIIQEENKIEDRSLTISWPQIRAALIEVGAQNLPDDQAEIKAIRGWLENDSNGSIIGKIEKLWIVETEMETIPKEIKLFKNLFWLVLRKNKIKKITHDQFRGLSQLKILVLNENQIKKICATAFENLPSLHTLDFSINPIEKLPCWVWTALSYMKRIGIEDTPVMRLIPTASNKTDRDLIPTLIKNNLRLIELRSLVNY